MHGGKSLNNTGTLIAQNGPLRGDYACKHNWPTYHESVVPYLTNIHFLLILDFDPSKKKERKMYISEYI